MPYNENFQANRAITLHNFNLVQEAARQNNPYAEFQLARCQLYGWRMPKNVVEGGGVIDRMSTRQDLPNKLLANIYTALAEIHFFGLGVIQNREQAVEDWKIAAGLGGRKAKIYLSHAYKTGRGVERDLWHGFKYTALALDTREPDHDNEALNNFKSQFSLFSRDSVNLREMSSEFRTFCDKETFNNRSVTFALILSCYYKIIGNTTAASNMALHTIRNAKTSDALSIEEKRWITEKAKNNLLRCHSSNLEASLERLESRTLSRPSVSALLNRSLSGHPSTAASAGQEVLISPDPATEIKGASGRNFSLPLGTAHWREDFEELDDLDVEARRLEIYGGRY